ncbi:tetratricopeptide repeat protein [Tumebacillus sp. ITR2]|uniref:Tetratricopeptide repeat protein n=1 Tax=Tumebacillus amylolyticus TaxID=2801339 RepID=A0ABS1JDR5_9BACL|nr:tetratricopeptide repeat protein [Tumebacillus amylolyticus]MBL0388420.1 tetratricopeptide repeat protein [Tumebacillus amylolyticus]
MSMAQTQKHRWITGQTRADREAVYGAGDAGQGVFFIEAHRQLRGPYTAAGELLRQLIPTVQQRWPELVERHVVEILSLAPELRAVVPTSRETLTSIAIPEERTRFYARARTLRLTNGVIELLKKLADPARMGPLKLVFENAGDCEHLDGEFFATILRRAHPAQIEVTLSTKPEMEQEMVREALEKYAERVEAPATTQHQPASIETDVLALAKRFVQSDGISDRAEEIAAYESLTEEQRQALHDERADELVARDEVTLGLGAIPWHRERGSSTKAAILALRTPLDYCLNMGFYESCLDFGLRGRKFVDWSDENLEMMWAFTTKSTNSLAALGRAEEAEVLYNDARAHTDNEVILMQAAYATSMLYTRHRQDRDHSTARYWINQALDLAAKVSDEKGRIFRTVFYNNGLALVEMHVGNIEEALRLVTDGQARLNEMLGENEQMLHRSVLMNNKAHILSAMKRYEEALSELNEVIAIDPNYPEYHFDRGNVFSKMDRLPEAINDYTHGIEISPPFPELYYNRAAAYNRMGETEKALADYSYLLEIEPTNLDGRLNRATLYLEAGETGAARLDVEEGLAQDPQHAQLLCTLGLIEMAEEHPEAAEKALRAALAIDETLLEAYANLSVLLFEKEDAQGAVEVLTASVQHHPQAAVLYFNRAWALQALERYEEAAEDYTQALELGSEEAQEIYFQRGACLLELGLEEEAFADWKRHLASGESPYLETIQNTAPVLVQ